MSFCSIHLYGGKIGGEGTHNYIQDLLVPRVWGRGQLTAPLEILFLSATYQVGRI